MYFTAYTSLVYLKLIKPRRESHATSTESPNTSTAWAPGTIKLQETQGSGRRRQLHPVPTSDPNDPLNWSNGRKALNFGLTCFYVAMSFVVNDINAPALNAYKHDLGVTFSIYTTSNAANFAGFAIGSFLLNPFVHKYGRRPLYLLSLAIQTGITVWQASMTNSKELIPACFAMGFGGSLSETIVQNTITDLFFVHQRARMNGIFLFVQASGVSLGGIFAGLIVEAQGWRWMWWWCTIIIGTFLLLAMVAFEETKYIPVLEGQDPTEPASLTEKETHPHTDHPHTDTASAEPVLEIDHRGRVKPYRERLALITPTPGKVTHHFYQPILVLFQFPAVAYAAIAYGIIVSWVATMGTVTASRLILPPWNFSPSQIGMMHLAPMAGHVVGAILAGTLGDYSIVRLAARNDGVFEPEMRLWVALPGGLISFTGLMLYGFAMANREHWIVIALGLFLYATGTIVMGTTALSYLSDSYQNIVGDALVAVVWVRNICSMIMMFAISPWLNAIGIRNTFLTLAFIGLAVYALPIAMLRWGKRARIYTAEKYHHFTMRQAVSRPIEGA